jgi:hypothetical protein
LKANDIALKLMSEVHKYTDLFSDVYDIVSINNIAGVCTVVTDLPHGLVSGEPFFLAGTNMPISITSLTRSGTVGTLVTNIDHDLTLPIAPTIEIKGADDAEFNGIFSTIDVKNRRTITFVMNDTGPVSSANGKLVSALRYDQKIEGIHQVLLRVDANTFTFNSGNELTLSNDIGKVKTKMRVSAAASPERAIQAYSKQNIGKFYLFAVLGDVRASQARNTQNDVIADLQRGNQYRQIIVESLSLLVITNTADEIAARKTRDLMSDLLVPLTKSIAFHRFPSGSYISKSNPLVFSGHSTRTYDGAVYIHEFIFESSFDLLFEDTNGYSDDVALRNINMDQYPDLGGTGFVEAYINLDTEPL